MKGPGWPSERGWIAIGGFALCGVILAMMAFIPSIRDDDLFKSLALLTFGTGMLGLVFAHAFGGSKATVSAIETVNEMARKEGAKQAVEEK